MYIVLYLGLKLGEGDSHSRRRETLGVGYARVFAEGGELGLHHPPVVSTIPKSAVLQEHLRTPEWAGKEGGCALDVMHGLSRMAANPRIPAMPHRSMSCSHRPGRHCVHHAQSAGMCWASRMRVSCILLRTACELDSHMYRGRGRRSY